MKKYFTLCLLLSVSPAALHSQSVYQTDYHHLFSQKSFWADSVLSTMTLPEKIGQMFVAFSYSSYEAEDSDNFLKMSDLVRSGKVGGVIFSRGDVMSIASYVNRLQRQAKIPLLISADMEWGVAMRIPRTTEFPSNMAVAATWNPAYAYEMGRVIAEESRALGVYQNYAPDVDLNSNPKNPIINVRAFSENIDLTNSMSVAFIQGTQQAGGIATAKHFPGHGDTDIDSHKDLPVLAFTKARLDSVELRPFKEVINRSVISVMVGHLAVPQMDSTEKLPATLSSRIVTGILKQGLGFAGLVVTDAMIMEGVKKNFTVDSASVLAVKAGNDVILMSPDETNAEAAVAAAVKRGDIRETQIDSSVRKILLVKDWVGLSRNKFVNYDSIPSKVATKKNLALAQEIADKSITLLRNENGVVPVQGSSSGKKVLDITLCDGRSLDTGNNFHDALKDRFANTLHLRLTPTDDEKDYTYALTAATKSARVVVVSAYVTVRAWEGKLGLDDMQNKFLQKLSDKLRKKKIPMVLVAFGSPYIIQGHSGIAAYLCAYSPAKVSELAVAKILKGEIVPQGHLPITIPGYFNYGSGITPPIPAH